MAALGARETLAHQVFQISKGDLFPPSLILVVDCWRKERPQNLEVGRREACFDFQKDQNGLDGAGEALRDTLQLCAVLFDAHGHVYYLVVCIIQEEIQVIQRRRILILEPVKQALLNHPKLHSPLLQALQQLLLLFAQLIVQLNVFKQILERNILIKRDDLVNGPIAKHVLQLFNKLAHQQPLIVEVVGLDADFGVVF